MSTADSRPAAIAVIGMAGRFPGAETLDTFWDNLRKGVESITHFAQGELEDTYGRSVQDEPSYVRARSILDGVEYFDAEFFNFLPREAELTDPQQRIFLEIAWEALESAGYDPAAFSGEIAVYAGSSFNTYLLYNLLSDRQRIESVTGNYQVGEFPTLFGNGTDFIATRTACEGLLLRFNRRAQPRLLPSPKRANACLTIVPTWRLRAACPSHSRKNAATCIRKGG